ncbi:MAG: hypothetical protein LBQ12_00715 [Deltaproteobacteria bacterium]|jgi:hypothetical protein|nr:hypothetical protein [Deltaproteobacteria bacterium]
MRFFPAATTKAFPAAPAAFLALAALFASAGDLGAEVSLAVKASLPEGDPRAATLSAWAGEFSRLTGWEAEVEFLGPGAAAGARTVMAEPDGLTVGFLSLDETVTRSLQDLSPYEAPEFQPAVLFPSGAPALVRRPGGPGRDLAALKGRPGAAVRLLAPSLNPVPGPTLLAVDAVRAVGARAVLRELPKASRRLGGLPESLNDSEALWASAYRSLEAGELLALPWEGLSAVRALGDEPVVALVLAGTPSAAAPFSSPVPEGPSLGDLGVTPGVRELMGFYYPSGTGLAAQEGVPAKLSGIAASALAAPQPGPFVTGPPLTGDEAQAAYEAETAARKAILESLSLAGGLE